MSEDAAFKDRVVVVTGAARGQGLATAERFGEEGALLVLTDVDPSITHVAGGFVEAIGVVHDVADEAAWERVAAIAIGRFGRVDALINNAGLYYRGSIAETSLDVVKRVLDVNQVGPLIGIRVLAPHLQAAGGGAIVNIASTGGLSGAAGASAYSMSKWALRGLTRCASAELAPTGIRVNCVLPGLIETRMAGINSTSENEQIVGATHLGRIGSSREVADVTAFLCSTAASYITGADFVVDGGLQA